MSDPIVERAKELQSIALPPLTSEKCSEEQVRMCFEASRDAGWTVPFD